jgi:hypothetical protein
MLKQAAINQLNHLVFVLQQITDEDYKLELKTLKHSSVGKHVRHIVEFYECLLFNPEAYSVNYDNRKRNGLLEENVKYTLDYITEIIDTIKQLSVNKRMQLISVYNTETISIETTLYRELSYNIEHTVHHLAIISIALPLHFPYILIPENFGYAESTIQNFKKTHIIK